MLRGSTYYRRKSGVRQIMNRTEVINLVVAAFMGAVGGGIFNFVVWLCLRPKLRMYHVHNQLGQRTFKPKSEPITAEMPSAVGTRRVVLGYQTVGGNELYLRMMVKNTGKRVADRCRGFLVNIEFESVESGQRSPVFFDSIPLIWSYDKDHSRPEVDVPNGVSFTLDIFRTVSGAKGFFPCINPMPRGYKFESPGKYHLTIVLTAQNTSAVTETMVIDWKGVWNDFEIDGYPVKIADE